MKRIFFILVAVFLSFQVSLFAKDFAPALKNSIFMSEAVNAGQSFDSYTISFQGGFEHKEENYQFLAAGQVATNDYQITAKGIWWPVQWEDLRLGIGGIYNFHSYDNISITNNFLAGPFLEFKPWSWFCLKANTVALHKVRTIKAIKDYKPYLLNESLGMGFSANFYPNSKFDIYTGGSSYSLFRYDILGAPVFFLGGTYKYSEQLEFSIEARTRWIDIFTNSAMHSSDEFMLMGRWRF